MSKPKAGKSEQVSKFIQFAKDHGLTSGGGGNGDGTDGDGGGENSDEEELPQIELPGDGMPLITFTRRLGDVMRARGLFRRDVTPVVVNSEFRRLEIVKPDSFRSLAEEQVVFFRKKFVAEGEARQVIKSMNKEVALGTLHSRVFWQSLPLVNRINQVRLPVMRESGAVELLPEGYDVASQTYTLPSPTTYTEMTWEEAVRELDDLLGEFPFSEKDRETGQSRSKSVVLAAMMTMFAGGVLPRKSARPGFFLTANSQRSGKSLLAKMAIIVSCGSVSPTSFAKKDEELKKVLDSAVMAAKPYLLFDNVKGLIESESLEAFMSSGEWEGRKLGGNDLFTAENPTVVFMTGNQATTSTDIQGRCLFAELFVEEADPQARQVRRVIDEEWLARPANRGRILSALWALVRHWAAIPAADRPRPPRKLVGFEAWSLVVPSIVLAAGYVDPLAPAQMDAAGDTELEAMTVLVGALIDEKDAEGRTFKMRSCEFGEVVAAARDKNLFDWLIGEEELSPKSRSALGKLFKRYVGRRFQLKDGRRVQFGSRGKKNTRTYVVEILAS